jgi:sRNA-binding protein
MADIDRPARGGTRDAGRGSVSPASDDAPDKSTPQAAAQDRRADAVAGIELLAERFPWAFLPGARRRPLMTGIEVAIFEAVRGAMTPCEVRDAVRLYTDSSAYLRRLLPGAARIDLAGNPVGLVTAAEAARAAETLGTRLIKSANRRDARIQRRLLSKNRDRSDDHE